MVLCAAAVGAVVLVFGTRLWKHEAGSGSSVEVVVSEGSATQVLGGAQTPVLQKQSTRIAAVGELETAADSNARVTTADGREIELRSHTRVSLGELQATAGQVKLLGGSIRCRIPHRATKQAFQVVTPDATVGRSRHRIHGRLRRTEPRDPHFRRGGRSARPPCWRRDATASAEYLVERDSVHGTGHAAARRGCDRRERCGACACAERARGGGAPGSESPERQGSTDGDVGHRISTLASRIGC